MMCEPKRDHSDRDAEFGELRDGVNTQTNDYQSPGEKDETYGDFKNRRGNVFTVSLRGEGPLI